MDQRRGLSALRQVPILAGVSDASLERVARACKWQEFEAGEQLVQYQDPSTDVSFYRRQAAGDCLFTGRQDRTVHGLEARRHVRRDRGHRPCSSVGRRGAIESSTVASLTRINSKSCCCEPRVAVATLKHVAAEVRRLSERVVEFSTLVVQNRIQAEPLAPGSGWRWTALARCSPRLRRLPTSPERTHASRGGVPS
jgi:hypothetical protein